MKASDLKSAGDTAGGSTSDAEMLRRDEIDPGTEFIAPRTEVEVAIAALWQDVLKIDKAGIDDNFFELGGDSLQAIALFLGLEKQFGRVLPPSTIIERPTVAALAELLSAAGPAPTAGCLVTLQAEGKGTPLFFVHEASGNLFSYRDLVRHLGPGRRIFGLLYPGQDQDEVPALSVVEMARVYVEAVKTAQPDGPYFLLGYSMGGSVAYEMACQLRARGDTISQLVLVDAGRPDGMTNGLQRVARKLSRHLGILSDTKPSAWAGHLRDAIRSEISKVRQRRPTEPHLGMATAPVPRRLEELINETLMSAYTSYIPGPYAGAIKVFRCMYGIGARWSVRDLGWEGRALGGIEVLDLPASHYEALSEPAVALVAAHIRLWLAEAAL